VGWKATISLMISIHVLLHFLVQINDLPHQEDVQHQQVIAAHDPVVSDGDVFIEKLKAAGLSRNEVLYALWESIAEGDNKIMEIFKTII